MNWRSKRFVPLLLVGSSILAGYLVVRPRMLRWGATEEEAREILPGDDLVPQPRVMSTRAITIDATAEQVWPWLIQMGMERAGFYSHDWVERLIAHACYTEGHSATRIHPELQNLKVGDRVPYGGGAYVSVHALEPFKYLVAGEAFVLKPVSGNRTRLVVRYRGKGFIQPAVEVLAPEAPIPFRILRFAVLHIPGGRRIAGAVDFLVADPLHPYMEVGMLKGIKERAEGYASAS